MQLASNDGGQPQASNLCSREVTGTEVGAGKGHQLEPVHCPYCGQDEVQEGVLTSKLVQLSNGLQAWLVCHGAGLDGFVPKQCWF